MTKKWWIAALVLPGIIGFLFANRIFPWSTFKEILKDYEPLAVWVEGLALVLIFGLELKEYKRQGRERIEQHEETKTQMQLWERQAAGTEMAANAARSGAEAAKENLEVLVNRERARLFVKIDDLERADSFIPSIKPTFKDITYSVSLYGFTPAFIVDAKVGAYLHKSKEPSHDPDGFYFTKMDIPKVISPVTMVAERSVSFLSGSVFDEAADAILKKEVFVHIRGFIKYKDVFGGDRETRFWFRWDEGDLMFLQGRWTKCGADGDNLET